MNLSKYGLEDLMDPNRADILEEASKLSTLEVHRRDLSFNGWIFWYLGFSEVDCYNSSVILSWVFDIFKVEFFRIELRFEKDIVDLLIVDCTVRFISECGNVCELRSFCGYMFWSSCVALLLLSINLEDFVTRVSGSILILYREDVVVFIHISIVSFWMNNDLVGFSLFSHQGGFLHKSLQV